MAHDNSSSFKLAILPRHHCSGFYGVMSAYWMSRKIAYLRQRLRVTNFFEKETVEDMTAAYLSRCPKTDLDSAPPKNNLQSKIENRPLPQLILILPLAYLLQSIVSEQGQMPAVLALLAVLSTPLAMHASVRFGEGFYLWIYQVIRLERRIGKPLFFASS